MIPNAILSVVSGFIFVYSLLILLRIFLTWFQGPSLGKPWHYLSLVTEPYLELFRKIKFLHRGRFDLTPLAAILVLIIALNIINAVRYYETISLGLILGIIIQVVWQSISWILVILALVCGIRIIGLLVGKSREHPVWLTIDIIVQPLVNSVQRIIKHPLSHIQLLLFSIAAILAIWIFGGMLVAQFVHLCFRLSVKPPRPMLPMDQ